MKTKILPFFAMVVLLLATVSIVRTEPQLPTNPPPTVPPQADYQQRVAAVGVIEPISENISIGSHLPGVVKKVYVMAGQEVKMGEPLFKLDTRALEASRTERLAAIKTAEAKAGKSRAELENAVNNLHFAEALADARSISAEDLANRKSAVEITKAVVAAADAAVMAAQADLKSVETDLARSTVTAPIQGRVLQVQIRVGEYASAGSSATPRLIMGDVSALNIRVDIDEHEAWRVRDGAAAEAEVRGNADLHVHAHFVRFEPLVIPKRSLTGDSIERVDTRVLQAIYRIEKTDLPLFVGQQMDVFIDATGAQTAMLTK